DASWWCGGNRSRGVGRYLDAWLRKYSDSDPADRVWIFPRTSSEEQRSQCLRRYGGQAVVVPDSADPGQLQIWWRSLLEEYSPQAVWILSPFERPWSVLDFGPVLIPEGESETVAIHAIVFDLLPLEHPKTILQTWPDGDQQVYRERLQWLPHLQLHAISPHVRQQVISLLQVPKERITTLEFGLRTDWIEVPKDVPVRLSPSARPLVVSISGGEWRKNLRGTLAYFAESCPQSHRLVVICKLGRKDRIKLWWYTVRLGIARRVQFTGEISDSEKWAYLFQAERGLFLSRAEGLGIPLLEYSRAAIPRIVISPELEANGFGALLQVSPEVATTE
ncbi:glycosyltransferase, partial [Candidatus Woesebacteria bacterium]|nr:glycosyltransferase [Candidatus Woesebacteria bacterium]